MTETPFQRPPQPKELSRKEFVRPQRKSYARSAWDKCKGRDEPSIDGIPIKPPPGPQPHAPNRILPLFHILGEGERERERERGKADNETDKHHSPALVYQAPNNNPGINNGFFPMFPQNPNANNPAPPAVFGGGFGQGQAQARSPPQSRHVHFHNQSPPPTNPRNLHPEELANHVQAGGETERGERIRGAPQSVYLEDERGGKGREEGVR
jgi:hypothetical protein